MASPKKAEATGTVGVTEFKPTLNGATAPVVEKVPVRYVSKEQYHLSVCDSFNLLMVNKSLAAAPQTIEAPKKAPKHWAMT